MIATEDAEAAFFEISFSPNDVASKWSVFEALPHAASSP
jgi:hypothetical protein